MAAQSPPDSGDEGQTAPRRRQRNQEPQDVVDELAIETKRTSLLDRVESQLRGTTHYSRLFFGFTTTDDKKLHGSIENEFAAWRESQEDGGELTGIMIAIGTYVLHFLEGNTETLFKALEFFNTLSIEIPLPDASEKAPNKTSLPAAVANNPPRSVMPQDSPKQPRAALLSGLRILHFTELHGVRTSTSWCYYVHNSKPAGLAIPVEESNCPELVFAAYNKMLRCCLKVKKEAGATPDHEELSGFYRSHADQMPTADDASQVMSKAAADYLFSYGEFVKTFVAPFTLTLHSELLWPVAPALVY